MSGAMTPAEVEATQQAAGQEAYERLSRPGKECFDFIMKQLQGRERRGSSEVGAAYVSVLREAEAVFQALGWKTQIREGDRNQFTSVLDGHSLFPQTKVLIVWA